MIPVSSESQECPVYILNQIKASSTLACTGIPLPSKVQILDSGRLRVLFGRLPVETLPYKKTPLHLDRPLVLPQNRRQSEIHFH